GVDRRHLAGVVSDVVLVADTQRSGAVVAPATDLTGLQDRAVVAVGGREVDDRAAQIDQRRGYLAEIVTDGDVVAVAEHAVVVLLPPAAHAAVVESHAVVRATDHEL